MPLIIYLARPGYIWLLDDKAQPISYSVRVLEEHGALCITDRLSGEAIRGYHPFVVTHKRTTIAISSHKSKRRARLALQAYLAAHIDWDFDYRETEKRLATHTAIKELVFYQHG